MSAVVELPLLLLTGSAVAAACLAVVGAGIATAYVGGKVVKQTAEFVSLLGNAEGLPDIRMAQPEGQFALDISLSDGRLQFQPISLQENQLRAWRESASEAERLRAKTEQQKLERWAERVEQEVRQKLALKTIEEQVQRMKAHGEVAKYSVEDSLGGAQIVTAETTQGTLYRYKISTSGKVAVKTEAVKGATCVDLLANVVRELSPDAEDLKVAHTEDYGASPNEEEARALQFLQELSKSRAVQYKKQVQSQGPVQQAIMLG